MPPGAVAEIPRAVLADPSVSLYVDAGMVHGCLGGDVSSALGPRQLRACVLVKVKPHHMPGKENRLA